MKRIILVLAAAMFCLTAMAQEQTRTMRVFRGGQVVFALDVTQIDSINFLLEAGAPEPDYGESYTEDLGGGVSMKMKMVQGGTFQMGRTAEQEDANQWDSELPVHEVTLDGFYIGAFEVTQAQWKAVMGTTLSEIISENGWDSYGIGDDYPMYDVSWYDAVEFCEKLSAQTGKTYRLPTEAEWEYAARGGQNADGTKYAGSNSIDDVAWYWNNSSRSTHPVGQKAPNGLGLYDMSGNVWEWCSDWWGYYSASPSVNPQGPASGSYRVGRGGSWYSDATHCRVAFRNYDSPGVRSSHAGFRVVCEAGHPDLDEALEALEASMVYVEGGTFEMGATEEQGSDAYDKEKPVHEVTLDGFYIGKFEVTQAQWKAVMGTTLEQQRDKANPEWGLYGVGDAYPMYYVSWEEAQAFCAKLSEMTGKTYRLPTEAEWEYAARGGNAPDGTKYAGSDNIDDVAWYWDNSSAQTHAVGQKQPNALGLYDMSGNVWEWCSDWYDGSDYSSSPSVNPQGPSSGSGRVNRGGGWGYDARNCRVSFRSGLTPGGRNYYLGFRVVCER